MKKKIFIVLIITLSLFSFNKNVLAKIEYVGKYGYECKDGYELVESEGKYVCCPEGSILINKATQGVQYKVCYDSKTKKEKSHKKASIVAEKETLTIKKDGKTVKTPTCTKNKGEKTCTIDLKEYITNDEKYYTGYCNKDNCKDSELNRSSSIEMEKSKTIYLYYSDIIAKCTYQDNVVISYGKKAINGYKNEENIDDQIDITGIMMYTYYSSGITCPPIIYEQINEKNNDPKGEGDRSLTKIKYRINSCESDCDKDCKCNILKLKDKIDYLKEDKKLVKKAKEGCAIIGEGTMKIINDILKIVRIIVPLLLIGLGILDFTKSVFSGKEDDMNKNRSKFIKRIVAGVLVFFVPMFVNLILNFANDAWSWMNPDTCIK